MTVAWEPACLDQDELEAFRAGAIAGCRDCTVPFAREMGAAEAPAEPGGPGEDPRGERREVCRHAGGRGPGVSAHEAFIEGLAWSRAIERCQREDAEAARRAEGERRKAARSAEAHRRRMREAAAGSARSSARSEVVRLSGEDDQSAVARHNATPEHLAWRVNRESQDGGPTAAHGARDVSARLSERPAAVLRGRGHDPSIPRGGRP